MIEFSALPTPAMAFIGCWILALFLGMVFLLFMQGQKGRTKRVSEIMHISILAIIAYLLLQLVMGSVKETQANTAVLREMIYIFENTPVMYIVLLCILLSAVAAVLMRRDYKWNRTHITDYSIKEAVDLLPVGVCAYADSGRVFIKNTVMERLCREMTGEQLFNGVLLEKRVDSHPEKKVMGDKMVYILPNEEVIAFSKEMLEIDGNRLTLLTACDMTEEYAKTQILLQKREAVCELNSKLISYNRDIVSIITSQEILNAKVKIHDELGAGLLAIRHFLIKGGDRDEKEQIIARLNQNLSFLQRDIIKSEKDEYLLIFTTAKALDVRIIVEGELPEAEPDKHIIATAIHECFTNVVRHAKGNLLHIRVTEKELGKKEIVFTNNGEKPTGVITERGGLVSLRSLVEKSGGSMKTDVDTNEGFRLHIYLG